jgi:hypothetical protein
VFGTPQYMSPEQGRGLPLDARSDLYALGILAFEMLTGMVPFHDENPMTVIQMHLHAAIPPMPDTVPYSVQQVVRRALEKDPGRRYQSAGEMMQHCQQVFAEVAGGVSIGAGGVPRTVVAPGGAGGLAPPGMQPPGMQPPAGQPPGGAPGTPGGAPPGAYQQASPMQKTMVAQPSPFGGAGPGSGPAPGAGMAPGGMQGSGLAPGGYNAATPMQKTIVAGMAPPIGGPGMMQTGMPPSGGMPGMAPPGGMPGMAPPGGMPGMAPPGGMPGAGPAASGPNKTMMLQPSEGIVSVARTGQAVQPASTGVIQQGASPLFWAVSLLIGVAVGALAYVVVAAM